MAGLKFQKAIPFEDVYIHGTVRDATGTKMSKSLGNVIDPLDVIKEVGSDALRYSVISITSQGQDVFLSKEKFEIGRNFANKIWNASRYVLMNLDEDFSGAEDIDVKDLTLADKWILDSFNQTSRNVQRNLGAYRFNDAAGDLYDFIWHKYCDWYLEISKFSENKDTAKKILVKILAGALQLLHPFMPFITEEIWQSLPGRDSKWIMTSSWPMPEKRYDSKEASMDMEKLIGIISSVRNVKSFWNITDSIDIAVGAGSVGNKALILDNTKMIECLARCKLTTVERKVSRPEQSVASLVNGMHVFVLFRDTVDIKKEKTRVEKKIVELQRHLDGIVKKLKNKKFLEKAPENVVIKEKEKKVRFEDQLRTLEENLIALG